MNARHSLADGVTFRTSFNYTDKHRNRKQAGVNIGSIHGLLPTDDLYLWGLLGLALSQQEPSPDFQATPYWCLKQLGIVHSTKKGSEEYRLFREAIKRLAGVRYECDAFYDPIRHEHREVSFGFLSYSLPRSQDASRAWRFAWDPIFWELCSATAGSLRFDMQTYRALSPAARRLYLLLKKLFWRGDQSPQLELRELGINVLGFAETLPTKELKRKVGSCARELLKFELIKFAVGQASIADCFAKKGKGIFTVQLTRGEKFNASSAKSKAELEDSPLFDPLVAIGFDRPSVSRILRQYPAKLIQLWADVTLAAAEQGRVDTSPQAFFQYYIKRAADGRSTPPDWWQDIQRQRREQEAAQRRERSGIRFTDEQDVSFERYIETDAKDAFQRVMQQLQNDLLKAGRSEGEAERFAQEQALVHFRNKFRHEKGGGDSPWNRVLVTKS